MNKDQFLPWSQLMAFGLGQLQLTPNDFWSMSLREMDAAIEGCLGISKTTSVPSRNNINHMMNKYPDEMEST